MPRTGGGGPEPNASRQRIVGMQPAGAAAVRRMRTARGSGTGYTQEDKARIAPDARARDSCLDFIFAPKPPDQMDRLFRCRARWRRQRPARPKEPESSTMWGTIA